MSRPEPTHTGRAPIVPPAAEASGSSRRRGFLGDLLVRFFFFFGQTLKILAFSVLVIALAGVASYWIVKNYIQGQEILVPNVTGLTVEAAATRLLDQKTDLSIQVEALEYSDLVARGEIISQFPRPDNNVKAGTILRVRVSKGTTLIPCPDVRSKNYLEAGIALHDADLDEGIKTYVFAQDLKKDLVIAQDPPPNALVERRAVVNLLVSLGPPVPRYTMPSLLDLTPAEADEILRRLQLRIGARNEAPFPGKDNGLIFDQKPPPGAPVSPGDAILVTVAGNERR